MFNAFTDLRWNKGFFYLVLIVGMTIHSKVCILTDYILDLCLGCQTFLNAGESSTSALVSEFPHGTPS